MPGLDPDTPTTTGGRRDHRFNPRAANKSDNLPAKMFHTSVPYPDTLAAAPGHPHVNRTGPDGPDKPVPSAHTKKPLPRLWLFTDNVRLPDPRPSVAHLPRGKAGVILRHDNDPDRAALGRDLARICRARRLVLVVAGDARLAAALHAGVHLRGGYWPGPIRLPRVTTSSAHSVRDLIRARRAGANLVFLSPAFPTASHAGALGLGPFRWAAMARHGGRLPLGALGGVDGGTMRRLPVHLLQAVGAIGALSTT